MGIVFLLVLSAGCIQNTGFGFWSAEFNKTLERNGASTQNLLPPTIEQLGGLEIELVAQQTAIEKQSVSQDQQAILLLMDSELNLVHMHQNQLLGQQQARLANLAFPNCSAESNLGKSIGFFENAQAQGTLAQQNFAAFKNQYKTQSEQTGIDFEALRGWLIVTQQGITQSKQAVQDFCP